MSSSPPPNNKRKRAPPPPPPPTPSHENPSSTIPTTPSRTQKADIRIQIPPTPPTSAHTKDESDMRHATGMNGVQLLVSEEDTGSPRTKVAYHFQGLQLEDGGDVGKLSLDIQRSNATTLVARSELTKEDGNADESAVRKRLRVLEKGRGKGNGGGGSGELEIPETPFVLGKGGSGRGNFGIAFGPERTIDPIIEDRARKVVLQNAIDPAIFNGSPKSKPQSLAKSKGSALARAYPSINRLSDSKSRAKLQRKETYPLFGSADASVEILREVEGGVGSDVQGRTQMTWQENEITGHDPSDPDDDGEGINGIGFRPTAAEAYQRGQRRKQQMAEYKSREAKEARARRQEKRRESDQRSLEEKEVARRVRFLEAEKEAVIIDI